MGASADIEQIPELSASFAEVRGESSADHFDVLDHREFLSNVIQVADCACVEVRLVELNVSRFSRPDVANRSLTPFCQIRYIVPPNAVLWLPSRSVNHSVHIHYRMGQERNPACRLSLVLFENIRVQSVSLGIPFC